MEQSAIAQWMAESFEKTPALSRWIKRLYGKSGIETRYSSLPDAFIPPQDTRFSPGQNTADAPTTGERMLIYERESVVVGTAAAQQAIENCCALEKSAPETVINSITHLIVVSCTGFFAPGLDQMIARRLNLRAGIERTIVGFMGCSAAFNALRLANHIVQAQSASRVLIVCVELCTLHIQPSDRPVDLIGSSIFADGAAACLVGIAQPDQRDIFEINRFYTELTPETESFMVWRIGDYGYTLHLSAEIPENLARIAPQALRCLFDGDPPDLDFWAIHPGGRAIVDHLASIFSLAPVQVEPSRNILRRYGNVSSPTILFVLQEYRRYLQQRPAGERLDGVAMAFGPGLVTELVHLSYRVDDAPPTPAAQH